jgi:hypothetical protein
MALSLNKRQPVALVGGPHGPPTDTTTGPLLSLPADFGIEGDGRREA